MKKPIIHLTMAEILDLHQTTIELHGGKDGIRDLGLLDSALHRPRSGYYNSLSEQAAALLQSLCMNHCFVDGNKRVALLATAVFLRMNGHSLSCKRMSLANFIIKKVIEAKVDHNKIVTWLEKYMVEVHS